ncbi:MAG: hypothetical protein AAGI28_13165 [Pseudomonadota bacterium]
MAFLQNWVLIVCVIAFTLCVVGGLLIIFERWTPTNPHTAKFLVMGVLASAVAAVTPGVGDLFGGNNREDDPLVVKPNNQADKPPLPGRDETETLSVPTDEPTDTAELPDPADSNALDPPSEGDPDPQPQPQFSAEVREWAEQTLPLRPFLDQPLGSTYPPCASRLRGAGAPAVPSSDAGACFDQLQDFNRQVITQHRDRRAEYIPQLELRAKNEGNADKWRYLRQEYASFTFGNEATNFETLSAIFRCDVHLMINLRDYGLLKERAGCPIGFNAGE